MSAERLEAALKALQFATARGGEFPDECYRIAMRYLVPYEALADAYDEADRARDLERCENNRGEPE